MATPGWYPDPAGRPGAFRYWDGETWGEHTSDDPFAAPVAEQPAQPQSTQPPSTGSSPFDQPTDPEATSFSAFSGYQDLGQQYPLAAPPQPTWTGPEPEPGTSRVLLVVVGALVATLVLGVISFVATRSVTGDDEPEAIDRRTTDQLLPDPPATSAPAPDPTIPPLDPTPTPDPAETDLFGDGIEPTIQQCQGGEPATGATGVVGDRITGGGLSMPKVRGFTQDRSQAEGFVFADGTYAVSRTIEQSLLSGWVAVYVLGGLDKSVGFNTPEQAAAVILECMAESQDFYTGFSGAEITDSRATTVDGADAWETTAEIRIDDPLLTVTGDAAKVVVVDTGDPETFGMFVSLVPIGDEALIAQQDEQVAALTLQD